jgi:hypothetical protein
MAQNYILWKSTSCFFVESAPRDLRRRRREGGRGILCFDGSFAKNPFSLYAQKRATGQRALPQINQISNDPSFSQGCQIFLGVTYEKREKIYQMASQYTI